MNNCLGMCGQCGEGETCTPYSYEGVPWESCLTRFQQCMALGTFLDLCQEKPREYSCTAMCTFWEDVCGAPSCLDNTNIYLNCMQNAAMPTTAEKCQQLVCSSYYAWTADDCH